MKRIFRKFTLYLLTVTLLCSVCFIPSPAEEPAAGKAYTPTPDWAADADGIYTISGPEDLAAFYSGFTAGETYSGKTVRLTADLDLNPGWDAASGEMPAYIFELSSGWSFKGTFDGQGHSISGFYAIPTGAVKFMGFFPQASNATIRDFSLLNSFIGSPGVSSGDCAIGAIAGAVRAKTVFQNLYIDAIVGSTDAENAAKQLDRVGGICGQLYGGAAEFNACVFAGRVSGNSYVGGILGTNLQSTNTYRVDMTDCAVYGTVRADIFSDGSLLRGWGKSAGGFIGREGGVAVLTRCLSLGSVEAAENQYSGAFAYLDRASNTGNPIIFRLVDCYTYDGAARNVYAIGLHDSRVNFTYHIKYTSTAVNVQYNQEALLADLGGDRSVMKNSVVRLSAGTASALYGIPEYNDWCGVGARLYPRAVADRVGFGAYAVKKLCVQQGSGTAEGSTSLRFLAVMDDIELSAFSEIGFEICISDGTRSVTRTLRGGSVYTSVIAAGEPISAEDLGGKWVFALELLNIPASGSYTFTIRPVLVDAAGTALTGTAGVTNLAAGTIAE